MMTLEQFVAELAKNNADEQVAIEGYFRLLSDMKQMGLPQSLHDDIAEIISDEMHHTIVLSTWITKLSGIQPNTT